MESRSKSSGGSEVLSLPGWNAIPQTSSSEKKKASWRHGVKATARYFFFFSGISAGASQETGHDWGGLNAKLGCITPYSERPSPKFYATDNGRPTSPNPAQMRSHPRFRRKGVREKESTIRFFLRRIQNPCHGVSPSLEHPWWVGPANGRAVRGHGWSVGGGACQAPRGTFFARFLRLATRKRLQRGNACRRKVEALEPSTSSGRG